MALWSKGVRRSKLGIPRLEDKQIEGETICMSRIMMTDSAKIYFEEYYIKERGIHLDQILFNLNEQIEDVGLNTLDNLLKEIKKEIIPSCLEEIPNWDRSLNYIISDSDLWLVTSSDINHNIHVFNRFIREEEWFELPDSKYISSDLPSNKDNKNPNEVIKAPTHTPDELAFYSPRNGCLVFYIDRILELCINKSYNIDELIKLYSKILLHELIHSCLDLYARKNGEISHYNGYWVSTDGRFTEESIDNALVLKCFEGTSLFFTAKEFIKNQPSYYRRGISLYEHSQELKELIETLIKHKLGLLPDTSLLTSVDLKDRSIIWEKVMDKISKILGDKKLKKLNCKKNIFITDNGEKIYIQSSKIYSTKYARSTWQAVTRIIPRECDYYCQIIGDEGFIFVPSSKLSKLSDLYKSDEKRFPVNIILRDEIEFQTPNGIDNIVITKHYHAI